MPKIFSNGIDASAEILTELGQAYGVGTLAELERAIINNQKDRIRGQRIEAKRAEYATAKNSLAEAHQAETEAIADQAVNIT